MWPEWEALPLPGRLVRPTLPRNNRTVNDPREGEFRLGNLLLRSNRTVKSPREGECGLGNMLLRGNRTVYGPRKGGNGLGNLFCYFDSIPFTNPEFVMYRLMTKGTSHQIGRISLTGTL